MRCAFAVMLNTLLIQAYGAPAQDYALPEHVNDWLHHPVYGDPSFDAFIHSKSNPIHTGAPPYEWPVNGFCFEDPVSKNWYLYAGLYAAGYALDNGKDMICLLYRSSDKGKSWEKLGPVFSDEKFYVTTSKLPVINAPDVSVVYADGRYHMVYDFGTENSEFDTVWDPKGGGAESGVAYAVADKPEGPFQRIPMPVYAVSTQQALLGKYRRGYAATLVKREKDWMVLFMMDSNIHYSWGLFGVTAPKPEGPYSAPVPLKLVEGDDYYPPLLEYFPAFVHEGYVYSPATSVALNRNYQAMLKAPLDEAMNPDAWEISQDGSVWHSDVVPNEYYGIWGQTFSGFVDGDSMLQVMYPSRNAEGMGTINWASRPWGQLYREKGFVLTASQGPSIALLKQGFTAFRLDAELQISGECAVIWDYAAALEPDKLSADASLHAASLSRYSGLSIKGAQWSIGQYDAQGAYAQQAAGSLSDALPATMKIEISRDAEGAVRVAIGGEEVWSGSMHGAGGLVGLLAPAHSNITATRFNVEGDRMNGGLWLGAGDAILAAGDVPDKWEMAENAAFRFGRGAVSLLSNSRAKWNFVGTGFAVNAPSGPEYGKARAFLNGEDLGTVDFYSEQAQPSHVILERKHLKNDKNALVLKDIQGRIPLDCIEIY